MHAPHVGNTWSIHISGSQTLVHIPLVVCKGLQGGMWKCLVSIFFTTKYIHSYSFYFLGSINKFLNFCVAYVPCGFLKMAIIISHSHYLYVSFVSILVFKTFDEMIADRYEFSWNTGGTWWQYRTHKWYTIRKSLGTTDLYAASCYVVIAVDRENNLRIMIKQDLFTVPRMGCNVQ